MKPIKSRPLPGLAHLFSIPCLLAAWSGLAAGAGDHASLDDVLRAVQARPGLCVHLGCGEGALTAQLAAKGHAAVHALEASAAEVGIARQTLQGRGLYGRVAVEVWTAARLPYPENVANWIVAEKPGRTSDAELMRVLSPRGVAWVRQGDGWRVLQKPWPAEFDEWTHARHGADGNMVSRDLAVAAPTGLRWVAGPAQDAGGRQWYYDHVLVSSMGRNFYADDETITARDAFNGLLLWERPFKAQRFREVGTAVPSYLEFKAKLGSRTSKVRPVAAGDRLYVATDKAVLALDAATGQTISEVARVTRPRELLLCDAILVVSETNLVRAFNPAAQRQLWELPIDAEHMVAGDGGLFILAGPTVVGLDLASGRERWRTVDTNATPAVTCTYGKGVLLLEKSTWRDDPDGCGVLAYSGQDGRLLWRKDYKTDQTHNQEARSFFARSLLWLQVQRNKVAGFDPLTGAPREIWESRGKHCATPVATERFFIAPECDFTDLETGDHTRARMFKSACRLPFIPCNGLLYSFPVQCECYPMLRGYMALSSDKVSAPSKADRLVKGPAFGRTSAAAAAAADDWPTYRHDVYRSGAAPAVLPGDGWKQSWAAKVVQSSEAGTTPEWDENPFVPGRVTAPVAAGGHLFVAVPDEHRMVALDATTGNPRWSYTTGGRIDLPPTIHEGLCLFGSHDGWVYCLTAAEGSLVWKFRAAPVEARMPAYGQIESPWPVPGNVLVDQGRACFVAGRHPLSDGGVFAYALDPRTGKVLWEKTLTSLGLTNYYSPMLTAKQKIGLDFEPVDVLVKDGDALAMSRWRFDPKNGNYKLNLTSTNYQAGALAVPRGVWGYGIRQTKQVTARPPAAFDLDGVRITPSQAALLLAGGTAVNVTTNGVVKLAKQDLSTGGKAVHDGLITAYGRLYLATHDGKVVCWEAAAAR
jgi:outer membrane protein assembly factor BamB